MELSGCTAIVTGASSGIGRAAALKFASRGANVVLVARRAAELEIVAQEIRELGGSAFVVAGDVADETTHERAVAAALDTYGKLDVAFNNAGALGRMAPCHDLEPLDWDRTVAVNLTSGFLALRHQLRPMLHQRSGSVIMTSTFVGHTLGFPGMAAYGAAKAGLVGLVKVAAVEVAEAGVRVNAIISGGVDTPMGAEGAGSPEGKDFVTSLHALRRVAAPEELADVALFLASDASSFITGAAVFADGGITVTRT